MAIFAIPTQREAQRKRRLSRVARRAFVATTATAAAFAAFGLHGVALADTTGSGNIVVTGADVLAAFGFDAVFPPDPTATTAINYGSTGYGYLKNEYIGVTVGFAGTYPVQYSSTFTAGHTIAGMISIGNTGGALTSVQDDKEALNGLSTSELFTAPIAGANPSVSDPRGYGVWPLASNWISTDTLGRSRLDYSCYSRVLVDGIIGANNGNVGGSQARTIQAPLQRNGNILQSVYDIGVGAIPAGALRIRQDIRLVRSQVQITWTIINNDVNGHTVDLRWTVPNRGSAASSLFDPVTSAPRVVPNSFYQDPNIGLTFIPKTYDGANVPGDLFVFGKRYDADNLTDPPFNARHIFRGLGATAPRRVRVADAFDLFPGFGGYDNDGQFDRFDTGITTASYYGPYTVGPNGGTQTIVVYYGNGAPTERYDTDFVTATEATESLQFNAAAALQPGVLGNTSANLTDVGKQFLVPRPFQVFGGVYSSSFNDPNFNITLTNVSLALALPPGLQFGINPATNVTDTPSRTLGNIRADGNGVSSWFVEPTGDVFGTVTYQMNVSTSEFGPRAVTRAVNIPATPLRPVTADGYQMLGFPFQFDPDLSNNGDPSTIINGLTRPVDEPVAFYEWVPDSQNFTSDTGRYKIATTLQPGVGYFYRPNLNRTIFLKGAQPFARQAEVGPSLAPTSTTQLQRILERGWNMVANPYVYEIPLNFLSFVSSETPPAGAQQAQSFREAVNAGLVRGGVFFYNTATKSYDFFENISDPIRPFQGYWLFTNSRIILRYAQPTQRQSAVLPDGNSFEPATRNQKRKSVVGVIASGRAFPSNPTTENWKVQLIAQNRTGASDKATLFGVSAQAKDGDDSRDLPKPPPPVEGYVYVGITKTGDKDAAPSRYAQDMKTPGGVKTWDFDVQADEDGPVTLSWPNVAKMPRRLRLQIKDKQTNKMITLRGQSSVTVNVRKGVPSRFQFIAGPQPTTPLSITGLKAVSGGRGKGGGYAFEFNITRSATITGRVLTQSGKEVARFANGRAAEPGSIQRISWNGRAQDGSSLPTGPYQVEIMARGDDDEPVRVRQSFISLQ